MTAARRGREAVCVVQEVSFAGNAFRDNGGMIIARALRQATNRNLKKLDLAHNEIQDDGAFVLANVRHCLLDHALLVAYF